MEDEKSKDNWLERAVSEYDAKKFADGDLVSHDWIYWALDIPPVNARTSAKEAQFVLLSRFDAFRDYMLIQRKICLQNVRGQGYRVVPPGEQAQVAAEEALRLIRRGLDKGDKILTHARVEKMTTEEANRHTSAQIKIGGLRQMVGRQRKDILGEFKPSRSIT